MSGSPMPPIGCMPATLLGGAAAIMAAGALMVLLWMIPGFGASPAATTPALATGGGGGGQPQPPAVSAREFDGGSAPLTVSGAFDIDPSMVFEGAGGWADGQGRTEINYWVGYEALPDAAIEILITAYGGRPYVLNVYRGAWVASAESEGCTWNLDATATTVSGQVTCAKAPAENLEDGSTGSVSIDLEFTAVSP